MAIYRDVIYRDVGSSGPRIYTSSRAAALARDYGESIQPGTMIRISDIGGTPTGIGDIYVWSGTEWVIDGELARTRVYNTTQDLYYSTISAAIAAANNNDIIEVAAGVYEEQLNITKPLTLRGPNYEKLGTDATRSEEAILRYSAALGNGNSMLSLDADGVTLEGLTFDCPDSLLTATPTPVFTPYPVFFYAVNNFTFRNNRMYGGEVPLYIYFNTTAKSGLLVEGNYIDCGPWVNDRYGRGMYIYGVQGTVQNNVVENASIGIQFSVAPSSPLSSPSTITNNKVSAALHGLYNNVMPKGTAQHNWTLNTVTVAPNDRIGLKKLVGGAGAPYTAYETTHFSAARFQYIGTAGDSSTPPTVSMTNNLFMLARDPNKVYNNLNWVGASFIAGSTGGGIAGTAVLNITNNSITGWTIGARNQGGANANMALNWWGTSTQGNVVIENTSTGSVTIAPITSIRTTGLPSTEGFL